MTSADIQLSTPLYTSLFLNHNQNHHRPDSSSLLKFRRKSGIFRILLQSTISVDSRSFKRSFFRYHDNSEVVCTYLILWEAYIFLKFWNTSCHFTHASADCNACRTWQLTVISSQVALEHDNVFKVSTCPSLLFQPLFEH